MNCLCTILSSILINGTPTYPFPDSKGFRQGDPLSPYLFVLAMDYLSRLLKTLKNQPDFNYQPRCERLKIIQLGFADDLLLFCRGDEVSIHMLYNCFMEFSRVSGLNANKSNSFIYFGGENLSVQQNVMDELGFSKGEMPIRYLGVPLSTKTMPVIQFQQLLDRMLGRITYWAAKFLSYAGRIQLIKSVLLSIQIYWSQIFVFPKKVIHLIEAIYRKFLWSGGVEVTKKI